MIKKFDIKKLTGTFYFFELILHLVGLVSNANGKGFTAIKEAAEKADCAITLKDILLRRMRNIAPFVFRI